MEGLQVSRISDFKKGKLKKLREYQVKAMLNEIAHLRSALLDFSKAMPKGDEKYTRIMFRVSDNKLLEWIPLVRSAGVKKNEEHWFYPFYYLRTRTGEAYQVIDEREELFHQVRFACANLASKLKL